MKKTYQMFLLLALTLTIGTALAEAKAVKVSDVNVEAPVSFAIHSPVFTMYHISEVTSEVVPFYTPEVIGSECEGFTEDVYHPPLKDCFHS